MRPRLVVSLLSNVFGVFGAWGALVALACLAGAGEGDPAAPPPRPTSPLDGAFLPKDDLRVAEFMKAHPEADGRGVLVAILDTGVDPGHPRLAKTTTGERKIVDFLDATDDGIVDTSTPAEAVDGKVVGLTGRVLTLGDHVKPGKKHYLGRIDAVDAMPPDLANRLRAKRKARHDEAVRRAKEAGTAASRPKAGEDDAALEARRAAEAEALDRLPDETPAYDVLVCEREDGWRVVVDTDGDGDLAEEREIQDFSVNGDWVTLHDDAEWNVGVRPDADGKRVRLLFDGGGHGTHVSGIVAGFDAPGSALNGVAPGARILAIKVGNSRYDSPTTNFAIGRALDWAGKRGAKVVNLSFGGPSFMADAGTPDARAADEATERYGLLCCFSAGNEGPCLSTVGSPAAAKRVLSVGAYVAPSTMKVSYSQIGAEPGERLFGFSSRGPLPGGDFGISVLAPGAAWSSLPSWHLVPAENWNGTSMAAPHVAGAAALLLSAAAKEGIAAPPARLIRAMKGAARRVDGLLPVEQGAGLVQVDRAFEALARMKDSPEERSLRASVVNATGVGGGVYVRDVRGDEPFDRNVDVSVDWPRDVPNAARAAYERRLVLASDQPWVEVPPRLALNGDGKSFTVRVDPKGLAEGVHAAVVTATDPARADDGPELSIPVTIVKAGEPDRMGVYRSEVRLAPGERASRFVRVPSGAGRVRVRLVEKDGAKNSITVALGSLDQWRRQQDRTMDVRKTLSAGESASVDSAVLSKTVLEIVLFSHWATNAPAVVDLEARFEGPTSPDASLVLGPGEEIALLRLSSPLGAFRGRVSARLAETVERPPVTKEVRPVEGKEPLFGGDLLFVSVQRFSVRLNDAESVTVRPLGTSALDEQREDARWRILDGAGRTAKKAVIDGAFDFGGLPPGEYVVEYETPTWRKAAAEAGQTGFEIRRSRPEAWFTAYPSADLATDATGASDALDLVEGSLRSVALRAPGLDAGAVYAGEVTVKDGEDRVRLTLPILVDRTTTPAREPQAMIDDLVSEWKRRAARVANDMGAAADARKAALDQVSKAMDLSPDDREAKVIDVRLRAATASTPADFEEVDARTTAALKPLDRANDGDRRTIGALLLVRSRIERLRERKDASATDFTEARFLLPGNDPGLLAERVDRGLAPGGDLKDAAQAAKSIADAARADFGSAQRLVEVDLRLGWGTVAAGEVRTWWERFPGRAAEIRAIAPRVRAAGGDPAPRTLSQLESGAP